MFCRNPAKVSQRLPAAATRQDAASTICGKTEKFSGHTFFVDALPLLFFRPATSFLECAPFEGCNDCEQLRLRLDAQKVAEATSLRGSGLKPLPRWAATLCKGRTQK